MPATMTDVERRRTAAYWYAVGHADGTGDTDRADDFSAFARTQAELYYSGKVSILHSIPDQWKEFITKTEVAPERSQNMRVSQSARDAQRTGYGSESYWDYLDEAAQEHYDYFMRKGDPETAERMMTQSLSESLMGNDGD